MLIVNFDSFFDSFFDSLLSVLQLDVVRMTIISIKRTVPFLTLTLKIVCDFVCGVRAVFTRMSEEQRQWK